jgi:ABC-type multidrug transport system fused ATPase/permease subunit
LIERFYGESEKRMFFFVFHSCADPQQGHIFHNGVDICELDPAIYRRQIGYVTQEPTLFSASIRDNILFGVEDETTVTEEMIHDAARKANCHDFIMEFENGYDTQVGERGVQL